MRPFDAARREDSADATSVSMFAFSYFVADICHVADARQMPRHATLRERGPAQPCKDDEPPPLTPLKAAMPLFITLHAITIRAIYALPPLISDSPLPSPLSRHDCAQRAPLPDI